MSRKHNNVNILVLQGGGALGAYQAGGFEELSNAGYEPDYVAGISIGAINSAIIAGNKPENRVKRLRTFWERASSGNPTDLFLPHLFGGLMPREYINALAATNVVFSGIPGFFSLRLPPALLYPPGKPDASSFYDTSPLRDTLLDLVDFDIINSRKTRFAVGAVNVRSGNLVYFDNTQIEIRPEHIMASGALPPGFPPIEIDGEHYWDGGIVSNTPLQYVLDNHDASSDTVVFQFDLFNARGSAPESIWEIEKREKEIRFSSRTRYTSDRVAELIRLRAALHRLYDKLPRALRDSDDVKFLMCASHPGKVTIVQLIYRSPMHERASKDYEFSRRSMVDHWTAGAGDAKATIANQAFIASQATQQDLVVVDAHADLPRP